MGGDDYCFSEFSLSSTEEEDLSLSGKDSLNESFNSSGFEEGLRHKLENVSVMNDVVVGRHKNLIDVAAERQRSKVYSQLLRSYEDFQPRIDRLEETKNKILSYTPGSFTDKAACMDSSEYDLPNATSLLLIGPKGSGKSSLVNRISQALETDMFLPGRAQVSSSSSTEDGTYFLHEYMIPRGSGSFCLYDTRGLSLESSENLKMIQHFMTKGVCHGEPIRRNSDSVILKAQLKCKARRSFLSSHLRPVDSVIFVVNGLSVLESMNSADEKKTEYSELIATNFNNPLLSFKDDKPAVAVTHGDLLSLPDRVRVRAYLGELLGIPPTGQIFDIPENNDPATTSVIFDMLIYCLERANRNFPANDLFADMVRTIGSFLFWLFAAAMIIAMGMPGLYRSKHQAASASQVKVDWHKIRHLWSE